MDRKIGQFSRKILGITLSDMAERMGCYPSSINRFENARRYTKSGTFETLYWRTLCDALERLPTEEKDATETLILQYAEYLMKIENLKV